MPKIKYKDFEFRADTLSLIKTCNGVIAEYAAQGFTLTLRQLYYQMVARAYIKNKVQEYKRLGSIVNDARLAGLIDWNSIEDRTRNLRSVSHWDEPSDIIESAATSFRMDKWSDQQYRPEVWIEKDALIGVIEDVCERNDVPYFSCRGYTSQSEIWGAAMRMTRHLKDGQVPLIVHLGDHDPSGIDMTRDITDRLELFVGRKVRVHRVALNMAQVDQYNPPPNPAKMTDSRFAGYESIHGNESWELDALEPRVIAALIETELAAVRDEKQWKASVAVEDTHREQLSTAADRWPEVVELFAGEED